MNIHPAAREIVRWPITGAPDDVVLEVSFDAGASWHRLTREGDTATVLVAGPDATDNPDGTVVLAHGRNHALIRATDNPEVPHRHAGTVDVRA